MAEIMIEETSGKSKKSLTMALANAIRNALKGQNGDHQLNITVIIEGYSLNDGEYEVSVKVMIMDITLEQEKVNHETNEELLERMNANQTLTEQMYSAVYSRPIYDNSNPVHALEHRMDHLSHLSYDFHFDASQDNITLVAPTQFHDHMRNENPTAQPHHDPRNEPPTFDLGGGSSKSANKDAA